MVTVGIQGEDYVIMKLPHALKVSKDELLRELREKEERRGQRRRGNDSVERREGPATMDWNRVEESRQGQRNEDRCKGEAAA